MHGPCFTRVLITQFVAWDFPGASADDSTVQLQDAFQWSFQSGKASNSFSLPASGEVLPLSLLRVRTVTITPRFLYHHAVEAPISPFFSLCFFFPPKKKNPPSVLTRRYLYPLRRGNLGRGVHSGGGSVCSFVRRVLTAFGKRGKGGEIGRSLYYEDSSFTHTHTHTRKFHTILTNHTIPVPFT
jgi:hypothetical protein